MEQDLYIFAGGMSSLYLFNPENDMALASGSPYYMAPGSAKKMAADLAVLPVWYAPAGAAVWLPEARQAAWLRGECPFAAGVEGVTELSEAVYNKVVPWGWSPSLLRRLREAGCPSLSLLSDDEVERVRRLSSRATAVRLLPRLRCEGTLGESSLLFSPEEAAQFVIARGRVLLKAPWSGSGRGIRTVEGALDASQAGWVKRVIASQGAVAGEPRYDRVVDFAMEFRMEADGVCFAGYSLFETDGRGSYKENVLASDEVIEGRLSAYVGGKVLGEVRSCLPRLLWKELGGVYRGYLGVDMMVCRTDGGYALHPCVEINLRCNMGVVSRLFFDRWVCPDAVGRYVIEYFPDAGWASRFDEEMRHRYPLELKENRIRRGYFSLTPVYADTCYQAFVCVED